jgi:hypothetical protein
MDTAPTSLAEGDVRSQARRGLAVFYKAAAGEEIDGSQVLRQRHRPSHYRQGHCGS